MEKKHSIPQLTGLKGIFSLVIVLYHTLPQTPLIDSIPLTSFFRLYGGRLGNSMFFLLSGFLMALNYRDRIRRREISAKTFLVRRLSRLYPLYILTVFLDLIHELLKYGFSGLNLKKLAFTVLLQSGGGLDNGYPYNYPAWFLSALMVCYLIYYFMAYHSKNSTMYCCLLAAGIIWGYSVIENGPLLGIPFAQNGMSLMNFFIGCALAEIYPLLSEKVRKRLQPASFFLLAASAVLLLKYGVEVISGESRVAFGFVICPLILFLALDNRLLQKLLMLRPVRYLGEISFSVYLWHVVVYNYFTYLCGALSAGPGNTDLRYLVYLVLMLAVSMASHRFLENRLTRHLS